ncbi:hypothetical protein MDA_GLEAN10012172 [Myotis davidii]|uniref:Uncharacterized protein n=1 Tax=Myotis davidii TaxID=225400 RepID=L5MJC9_MYODS|nr:hypothetical protein MDA_GLEAN10012172 [Myotis davidii]
MQINKQKKHNMPEPVPIAKLEDRNMMDSYFHVRRRVALLCVPAALSATLHYTAFQDNPREADFAVLPSGQCLSNSHLLLEPVTGPDHSVPSVGGSGSCWPWSPLRASPPPPSPEGRSGQQLLLSLTDGAGTNRSAPSGGASAAGAFSAWGQTGEPEAAAGGAGQRCREWAETCPCAYCSLVAHSSFQGA